jgi:glycosyltransferase involved in cell wall biosynthesis
VRRRAPSRPVPRVSVVIPTYGHRDLVLLTIESVFAQRFTDIEVIVVNDGSPDDTAAVLSPLATAGRIVYIEQENRGQAAARNRGIAAARGRYIALLDDDDLWPADKLEWQVRELEAHPEAVLVYGVPALLQPDGGLRPVAPEEHPHGRVYRRILRDYCLLSPGQALIRASTLRAIGGLDHELWGVDDWDLYLRLARRGEFRFVDRVALHYRLHEQNASRNAIRHFHNAWKAIRKHSGWNVPLIVRQLRSGRHYFTPNLTAFGYRALREGRYGEAARAYGYAVLLRPGLVPGWVVRGVGRAVRVVREGRGEGERVGAT